MEKLMNHYKFTGNPEDMKKTIHDIVKTVIRLDTHDLFLTGADTTMFSRKGRYLHKLPEFKELTDFVLECCAKEKHFIVRPVVSWANVYPKGSYIRPHNHVIPFNSMLSVVYYLQGNGCLHFQDGVEDIEEGSVVIFDGIKMHWTEPHEGSENRIIVGFDIYQDCGDMSDQEFNAVMVEHEKYLPTLDFN
jgi:hypothetical protein